METSERLESVETLIDTLYEMINSGLIYDVLIWKNSTNYSLANMHDKLNLQELIKGAGVKLTIDTNISLATDNDSRKAIPLSRVKSYTYENNKLHIVYLNNTVREIAKKEK